MLLRQQQKCRHTLTQCLLNSGGCCRIMSCDSNGITSIHRGECTRRGITGSDITGSGITGTGSVHQS